MHHHHLRAKSARRMWKIRLIVTIDLQLILGDQFMPLHLHTYSRILTIVVPVLIFIPNQHHLPPPYQIRSKHSSRRIFNAKRQTQSPPPFSHPLLPSLNPLQLPPPSFPPLQCHYPTANTATYPTASIDLFAPDLPSLSFLLHVIVVPFFPLHSLLFFHIFE